jgi:protein-S-isoprenylcysteine O-methyltransferase Ste14
MQRLAPVFGSILFFFLAPGTMAGLIPWLISRWRFQPGFFDSLLTRLAGAALILAGLIVLVDSFARFALRGEGTPAPMYPTRRLVVSGLYRHVRNPMYVAVVTAIAGQALLFADAGLLVYGVLVWLIFHTFVILYEEPTLKRTFADEYEFFRTNVPRWIPRLTPWRQTART